MVWTAKKSVTKTRSSLVTPKINKSIKKQKYGSIMPINDYPNLLNKYRKILID